MYLPIIAETCASGEVVLFGHMARANPQWRHFLENDTFIIFNGPHAYITPQWYKDPMNVPTWNYAVVHASGKATPIESSKGIEQILRKSVDEFERHEPKPWKLDLPTDFQAELVRGIVGFEMVVSKH